MDTTTLLIVILLILILFGVATTVAVVGGNYPTPRTVACRRYLVAARWTYPATSCGLA
jgi:hypothetical protein